MYRAGWGIFIGLCGLVYADSAFELYAPNATRVEIWFYQKPIGDTPVRRVALHSKNGHWLISLSDPPSLYYGFRVWGPNWDWDERWKPGTLMGFKSDVSPEGHRYNPNKLLIDPKAKVLSHELYGDHVERDEVYNTGEGTRELDSGPWAPKSVVTENLKPERFLGEPNRSQVVYELHVRGFTLLDYHVPKKYRGTYRGLTYKIPYLKSLGVTAIELMPVFEFSSLNSSEEKPENRTNYWGYMPLSFFALKKAYSSDPSPQGALREFQEMVRAFHDAGIRVVLDVVYNHTAEGNISKKDPNKAVLYSYRGVDSKIYYQPASDPRYGFDNNGCGANVHVAVPEVRQHILSSLKYWHKKMGVDGFRFDLASVLGNQVRDNPGFVFDGWSNHSFLKQIRTELSHAWLIAEPWAIGEGTYQVGKFPQGWYEWNPKFRDSFRKHQNRLGIIEVTPGELASRFTGSSDLYAWNGREALHSINYMAAHDDFVLYDLYWFLEKQNHLPYPDGPSPGGENNSYSWNQMGDPHLRLQATRNAIMFLALSRGTMMLGMGDEFLRTQKGNNNPYNLDTPLNWVDWRQAEQNINHLNFVRSAIAFRHEFSELEAPEFYTPKNLLWWSDQAKDSSCTEAMMDAGQRYLGFQILTPSHPKVSSIFVAYLGDAYPRDIRLPKPAPGKKWYLRADTSYRNKLEGKFLGADREVLWDASTYGLDARSVAVFIER